LTGESRNIVSEIWIIDDGSGKIQATYRMPKVLIEGLKDSEHRGSIMLYDGVEIPGQFSEYAMRDEIDQIESLTLSDYKVWREGDDVFVYCEIEFSNAEELCSFDLIPEIYVKKEGDTDFLEQDVCSEFGMDTEKSEVIRVYKDYKNTFIIHAPRQITSYNMGELSEDKKTLIFEYNVLSADECKSAYEEDQDDTLRVEW